MRYCNLHKCELKRDLNFILFCSILLSVSLLHILLNIDPVIKQIIHTQVSGEMCYRETYYLPV